LEDAAARLARIDGRTDERTANIAPWVQEAVRQFIDAPVQALVPIHRRTGASARTNPG
jgi:hypothetical protein